MSLIPANVSLPTIPLPLLPCLETQNQRGFAPHFEFGVDELEKRFEKWDFLGSGGEGSVYLVIDRTTEEKKALKIAKNNERLLPNQRKTAEVVGKILSKGLSPHLTRIDTLLSIRCLIGRIAAAKEGPGFFGGVLEGMAKEYFPRRGFLMEKMEGNLGEIYHDLSEEQKLVLKIQILSIQLLLESEGVCPSESGKHKNVLYKKLGPEDVFKGVRLCGFAFWKYVFGKYALYLPRPDFLVKLGDYDPWSHRETAPPDFDPERFLDDSLRGGLTTKILSEKFPQPQDSEGEILDVFHFP